MSLVGTRPPTLDEFEKYEYHHRARLAIRPGITGMWQVSGRSNILDFEEVVRLDTEYINSLVTENGVMRSSVKEQKAQNICRASPVIFTRKHIVG